jgi:hypothetical protein
MANDFRFEWQDTTAGIQREQAERAALERGSKTTLWGGINAAVETDSLTKRIFDLAGGDGFDYDPAYRPDEQRWRAKFQAAGIGEEHSQTLAHAVSEKHEDALIGQIKSRLDAENYLGDMGWSGVGLRLATGLLDPVSLATNAIPMGWATKGGAVKAAIKTGLAVGAQNAAMEGFMVSTDPTFRTSADIRDAALTGFVLGAPLGGIMGLAYRKAAHDAWLTGTLKDVQRTPVGEKAAADLAAANGPVEGTLRLPPPYRSVEGEYFPGSQPFDGKEGGLLEGPEVRADTPRLEAPYRPVEGDFIEGVRKAPDAPLERTPETIDGEAADVTPKALPAPEAPKVEPTPEPSLKAGDTVTFDVNGKDMTGTVKEELPNGDFLVDTGDKVRRVSFGEMDEGGSFIKGGSIGSGQRAMIEDPKSFGSFLKIGRFKIPLRWDLAAHFDRWGEDNPLWRKLGRAFVDDPGTLVDEVVMPDGSKKKVVRTHEIAASEYAEMEYKRSLNSQMKAGYDAYDEYAKRAGLGASKFNPVKEREFFEGIGRIMRDPEGELAQANPEMVKAANEIRSQNRALLERLKKAGWEGAENIKENDLYLMRKWDLDTIGRLMADPKMKRQVHELIGNAILKVRPDLEVDKAKRIAKHFIDKLREVRRGDARHMSFLNDGGKARLAELLRQGDVLEPDEVDDILDWVYGMQPANSDAGQMTRLKKRTFMDESYRHVWTDEDGTQRALSISDLLVNDVRALQSQYTRQMAGAIAMAKKGYRSLRDIQNAIDEAVKGDDGIGVSEKAMLRRRKIMEGAVREIMGQPFSEAELMYDSASRVLRGIRHTNFIQYMGQVGFASIPEYAHILATQTVMALEGASPAYKNILKMAKKGKLPKDLYDDLQAMGAVVDEGVMRQPVWQHVDGSKFERFAKGFENSTAEGAHYISRLSGIQTITTHQRKVLSKLYSKRLIDLAVKDSMPDSKMLARLADNGIDENDLDTLFAHIRKYVETDGEEIVGIDYRAWEAENTRTFDLFRNALHRESHRGIQEVTLGSTPPWMHNEVGKLLMQFRSFAMTAFVKQTLHGIAHRDLQTFLTWSFGMAIAAPVYAFQTWLNYHGDQEKLNKRLTPGEIAKASFQRAGFSSMIPAMVDTVTGFGLGDPIFAHGRTTGLASGVTGNPTFATAEKGYRLGSAAAQSLLTDDFLMLEKDARALTGLLPNLYGIRGMLNTWASDFPSRNYLRQYED